MNAEHLAAVAALLADRSRAAICLTLLDGRAWTVGELARHIGVAPSTASEHVAKLVSGGLLVVHCQGRHRYASLSEPWVAQVVEELGELGRPAPDPVTTAGVRSLRAASAREAMARARTCYDHLAGRLGVRMTTAMTQRGLITQACGLAFTEAGLAWLETDLEIDVAVLAAGRRPAARACIDWTERRPHLGGAAGAAICGRFFDLGWIERIGSQRAVRVTRPGAHALREILELDLAEVA